MRFANIRYLGYNDGKNRIGVGDYIQLLAIDNLYKQMGIRDVVWIDLDQIATYKGEYLILPINQLLGGSLWLDQDGNFLFSEKIIPVFLGVSLRKGFFKFTEHNLNILRKSAPVGCRDYYTYKEVSSYDIPAYVSGCLTLTLPKSKHLGGKKTLLVDVPKSVETYLPKNVLNGEIEVKQQVFEVSDTEFQDREFARKLTQQVYSYYVENAKLIITSRLHCAAPCMALGIPVILVKQYRGYTFDWLEKFINIYTEENYAEVDWNVSNVDLEKYKKLSVKVASERLLYVRQKYHYLELNEMYNFDVENYHNIEMPITHFISQIESRYPHDASFDYAIWGISQTSDKICEYLDREYPNARLVKVIDSFTKRMYRGVQSVFPDSLTRHDDFLTIVATINCVDSGAKPLFKKLQKESSEYIYAADEFISLL